MRRSGPTSDASLPSSRPGFVLFTLFVNGTTLRLVIGLLGLDRLSLRDQALRDRVLALSYAEISESVREMAQEPALDKETIALVAAPYEARVAAGAAAEPQLAERDRLAVALVALGNQERALVLETLAGRAASPAVMQVLLDQTDALVEGARAARAARLSPRGRCRAGVSGGVPCRLFCLSCASGSSGFWPIASPIGSRCC